MFVHRVYLPHATRYNLVHSSESVVHVVKACGAWKHSPADSSLALDEGEWSVMYMFNSVQLDVHCILYFFRR
jgi:hypothetical protein